MKKYLFIVSLTLLLTACGFHLQGEEPLAPVLHNVYLQTSDPYGQLARQLEQALRASNVKLASSATSATAVINILQDSVSQDLLSVSSTQQTRQYNLHITVIFNVTDTAGRIILEPQTLVETRAITIQSNQILASNNIATLFYQQMRRTLAYAILNRLASKQVTAIINNPQMQTGKKKR